MKISGMPLGLAIVALAAPGTAMPVEVGIRCVTLDELVSPAAFRRYPAAKYSGRLRGADVRRGQAHLYRTRLREEAREAPNLAGHYQVVPIGCGAGTYCPAFIDRATGKVQFFPELRAVTIASSLIYDRVGTPGYGERLLYRVDSRLLAVVGSRNEDERTEGVTLYEWHARGPRLIRFVPHQQLCRKAK